jgi:hypothetical protein
MGFLCLVDTDKMTYELNKDKKVIIDRGLDMIYLTGFGMVFNTSNGSSQTTSVTDKKPVDIEGGISTSTIDLDYGFLHFKDNYKEESKYIEKLIALAYKPTSKNYSTIVLLIFVPEKIGNHNKLPIFKKSDFSEDKTQDQCVGFYKSPLKLLNSAVYENAQSSKGIKYYLEGDTTKVKTYYPRGIPIKIKGISLKYNANQQYTNCSIKVSLVAK